MRHCPKCGAEMTKEAFETRKCLKCGYSLAAMHEEKPPEEKRNAVFQKSPDFGYAVLDETADFDQSMPVHIENWQRVFYLDFTWPEPDMSGLSFVLAEKMNKDSKPFPTSPGGMMMRSQSMFWINDLDMPSDVRVVMSVCWPEKIDGLEILINTVRQQQIFDQLPPGYGAQFGGFGGAVNFLARTETPKNAYGENGIKASFECRRIYKLTMEREADRISQYVDDVPVMSRIEPLPLSKEAGGRLAIKSWANVQIQALAVYCPFNFEQSDPFEKVNKIFISGNINGAIDGYLSIAEGAEDKEIAEQALIKAYLAACRLESTEDLKSRLRQKMETDYPASPYILTMMEADVLGFWKDGRYQQALEKAAKIFDLDPMTRIIPELLTQHRIFLKPDLAHMLLVLLTKTQDLVRVDISRIGLADLTPVSKMPLRYLSCGRNRLVSLEPLHGMPLAELAANLNEICSLEPLEGMELENLEINGNKIDSLEPLRGMPLKTLNCNSNPMRSLEPLRGMELEKLICGRTKVHDLSPLEGMPLKYLNVNETQIADLKPLSTTPLKQLLCSNTMVTSLEGLPAGSLCYLECGNNKITDLEPLRGMNLKVLNCMDNPITTLEPLRGMKLQELECSGTAIESLEPLSGLPLKKLYCRGTSIKNLDAVRPCPLEVLDCRENMLNSLGPFEDDFKIYIMFSPALLTERYFEKLISKWSVISSHKAMARKLRIERAFELGDAATLRELAVPFKGRRYLYIEKPISWPDADKKTRQLGGFLLSINSREENDFVFSILFENGIGSGSWLGIETGPDGKERWVTGEPIKYTNYLNDQQNDPSKRKLLVYPFAGKWIDITGARASESGFIMEWLD